MSIFTKLGTLRGAATTVLLVLAALATMLVSACAGESPNDLSRVPPGEEGEGFYAVDQDSVTGPPGELLQAQRVVPEPIQGATTWRVLYISRNGAGVPIAVSGTVSLPGGPAPKEGWPVLSYGHGTVGVADKCAPSRTSTVPHSLHNFINEEFVVAQSDYEGLGTPGGHPYLNGHSEARGVIDIVRAASALDERISTNWIALGYSQGAKAVLWAADMAPQYGDGLQLRGTIAIAPPHLTKATDTDTYVTKSASALSSTYLAMILSGAVADDPSLAVRPLLTQQGWSHYQQLDEMCIRELESDPAGTAGLAPRDFFDGTRALHLIEQRDRTTDAANAHPTGKLLLLSGDSDERVPHQQVAELANVFLTHDTRVTYRNYEGTNHYTLPSKAQPDIQNWITQAMAN